MRIIITGGTGLIGRPLAAALVSAGHDVVVLSRNPARVRGLPANVRAELWDAHSAAGWSRLAGGEWAIVNLAGGNIGEGRWTEPRKRVIVGSRVQAGQAVVEAVRLASTKPVVVVQASAIGFYGPHGDAPLDESAGPGQDFPAQVGVAWEAATQPVEVMGVRRVVVRTGVVLAREGGALPRMLLPFRVLAGGPYGNGRQWFSWIHIADEVRAIQFLLETPAARGAFNLTAPESVTNRSFVTALGRIMRRPAVLPVPALAFRILFGEMATILLDGQRVAPKRLLELGFEFQFAKASDALRGLLDA